jgi:uncharacterized protein (DUF1684 family)
VEKDGKSEVKVIELTRAHLEEDAGKSLHEDYQGMTGIDLNRAGTPCWKSSQNRSCAVPPKRSLMQSIALAGDVAGYL